VWRFKYRHINVCEQSLALIMTLVNTRDIIAKLINQPSFCVLIEHERGFFLAVRTKRKLGKNDLGGLTFQSGREIIINIKKLRENLKVLH
jgi:hypothetical protein